MMLLLGKMAEAEPTDEFAAYELATWLNSNGSSNNEHLALQSLGDVIICVVAAVLSVVTAGGNLLVVVSYRMDRNLQTVSNYFLLSLSVADFTIGAISMPLYTAYLVLGYWPLGPPAAKAIPTTYKILAYIRRTRAWITGIRCKTPYVL